jgi:hypothetical protein
MKLKIMKSILLPKEPKKELDFIKTSTKNYQNLKKFTASDIISEPKRNGKITLKSI